MPTFTRSVPSDRTEEGSLFIALMEGRALLKAQVHLMGRGGCWVSSRLPVGVTPSRLSGLFTLQVPLSLSLAIGIRRQREERKGEEEEERRGEVIPFAADRLSPPLSFPSVPFRFSAWSVGRPSN